MPGRGGRGDGLRHTAGGPRAGGRAPCHTRVMADPLATLPFDTFWNWLMLHPNCILRAGTADAVIFDDDDLHWHFAQEGPEQERLVKEMLDDEDLLRLNEREMRRVRGNRISMVFQEPMTSLNPVISIGTQISEILRRHIEPDARAATGKAVTLLMISLSIPFIRATRSGCSACTLFDSPGSLARLYSVGLGLRNNFHGPERTAASDTASSPVKAGAIMISA